MRKQFIASKRFSGVCFWQTHTKGGALDKVYYITYKLDGRFKRVKVGKHSEGIREEYCHRLRSEIITKVRLGEASPLQAKKKEATLDQAAALYFEHRKRHFGHTSCRMEQGRYDNHIQPVLGACRLDALSVATLEKLQLDKTKTHATKTVNHILTLASAIFNFAKQRGLTQSPNPLSTIKLQKTDNARERYLSKEEMSLLLEKVSVVDEDIYLFCLIALTTGARVASILSIKKQDINLLEGTITLKDHKNNSTYQGFITPTLKGALLRRLEPLVPTAPLLLGEQSRFHSRVTLEKKLSRLIDDLFNQGLDRHDRKSRAVIHTLRHTFASQLAIQGTPIFTIKKLMNHKDINMTLRYAKLSPDNGRKEVLALLLEG